MEEVVACVFQGNMGNGEGSPGQESRSRRTVRGIWGNPAAEGLATRASEVRAEVVRMEERLNL